jgi:hypothetical protein
MLWLTTFLTRSCLHGCTNSFLAPSPFPLPYSHPLPLPLPPHCHCPCPYQCHNNSFPAGCHVSLFSALRHIVVVCVVACYLGSSVAICIVVHCLCCCPLSVLGWVVVSPHCLCRGVLLLSALLPIVWVVVLLCGSSSIVCVVVSRLHRHPSSALRWGFYISLSSVIHL